MNSFYSRAAYILIHRTSSLFLGTQFNECKHTNSDCGCWIESVYRIPYIQSNMHTIVYWLGYDFNTIYPTMSLEKGEQLSLCH